MLLLNEKQMKCSQLCSVLAEDTPILLPFPAEGAGVYSRYAPADLVMTLEEIQQTGFRTVKRLQVCASRDRGETDS